VVWEGGGREAAPYPDLSAARVYYNAGRSEEALKAAEQGYRIAEADENLAVMRNLLWAKGLAYLGLGKTTEAQETADELKALVEKSMNKKSIRLYQHLQAQIDLENRNYERAIVNLKAALALLLPQNPHSDYYDSLAKAYEGSGDLENARKTYEKMQAPISGRFTTGNLYALSFYRLGLIAEKQGDKARARENYQKFLEIWKDADPGLPELADAKKRLAALS